MGKPGFVDALQALYDYRIRERLPEIACPTLVVWGAADPDRAAQARLRVRGPHPGGPCRRLPGAGHAPMLELPERFNRVLLDFLAEAALAR